MKKLLLGFLSALMLTVSIQAQVHVFSKQVFGKDVPTMEVDAPNLVQLAQEDALRDKQGLLYRIGVARTVNLSPLNAGIWSTLPNGDRQWTLRVRSAGAEALSFLFQTFKVYNGTTLEIKNNQGSLLHPVLTQKDVETHFMYNAALCSGDEMILVLTEPKNSTPSELFIDRIMYNYRSTGMTDTEKINESGACEVNVNCTPVGDNWQDEKRGVARIYVVEGGQAGWCTGSLVNNLANDCKPLFLTALHCGVNCSAADFNQWKFYFRYESPNCTNPNTAGTLDDYFINGCVKLSDSGDGGGSTGSDFLLVQLGTVANQASTITTLKSANFNAYWNGWDANNTVTTGGAGIHHPAGDIKKISTFSGNTVSSTWGSTPNTHWRLVWTANTNGHGVTEGGSSGSPIFNNSSGRIIGTLTGGGSFCNATNQPDFYGKVSYHWISNGTTNNRRLKPFLDPANTGALTQNGSADPCSSPSVPVANFVGNPTTVNVGGTVAFTDQSSGSPTSWSWAISGGGWTYSGGTSATSQNPQVTFNTVGQYTVTLTATNALGNDAEVKTNYINVVQQTGPCTPSATTCDEYIQNVTLNTINNTTSCTSGGYADYGNTTTTLVKNNAYSITVAPGIIGQAGITAYTDDEIAVWIDYNNDMDFADAGEQVGYVLVAAGWSNVFNFTVPTNATTGLVNMRVRISFSDATQGGAPIDPCAAAT
ncbi:MAG: GEVED domain-containing protein, partial [Flavobacteriales bacterium]